MIPKKGRYSIYIRPVSYCIDIAVIVLLASVFNFDVKTYAAFTLFVGLGWIISSISTKIYETYRFTRIMQIATRNFFQIVLFALIVFAFFGVFQNYSIPDSQHLFVYIFRIFVSVLIIKLSIHYLLRIYRKKFHGNQRKTIIIGNSSKAQKLEQLFINDPNFGYHHKKSFKINQSSKEHADYDLKKAFKYILENHVDEIYCSISSLSNQQIKSLVDFADNNLKLLKFIPDNNDVYTKQLKIEFYDYIPILSFRIIPIEEPLNKIVKRIFDIVFSSFVILFVLSWLTPILAIFIKLTSKGPVFFRQYRNGLNYKEFSCYKFRSMKINPSANIHQVSKDDVRVTKIGKFMRKTSIDELPQFFNVFIGNMSIVGPRPHMVSHTHMYAEKVNKFMVRHFVKPGITGLAQVSGYRGEIESETDIVNRVKYDIFYIENWSLLLDIKIIIKTILNGIKGDQKAY